MKIEMSNIRYENGCRVCDQKNTYNKSDDIFQLAQYQNQLAQLEKRLEMIAETPATTPASEITYIQTEKEKILALLALQDTYLKGYEANASLSIQNQ